jgi:hypothetical protein
MDHEKDIAEYKKGAKQADAAGEYAKGQIDVLQGHLQAAKSLKSTKTSNLAQSQISHWARRTSLPDDMHRALTTMVHPPNG